MENCNTIETFEISTKTVADSVSTKNIAEIFKKTFMNIQNEDEEVKKAAKLLINQFNALKTFLTEIIIEGQKTGEFVQDDPEKLTVIVLASTKGLTSLFIHHPELYKKYYPYTDIIMRLVKNSNYFTKERNIE